MGLPFDSLLLVGCGRMGSSLAELWSDWRDGRLSVFDKDKAKAEKLATKFGLEVAEGPQTEAELAVLAVKPSHLVPALMELAPGVNSVVSVAAAVPVAAAKGSGRTNFIRAMPNISLSVGGGITALYAPASVPEELKKRVEALFAFGGESFWVEDEAEMDIYTAFSGCGPAYVFHFVRALAAAANSLGVRNSQALAIALLQGALPLLQAEKDPKLLEERVKSPMGATEAALQTLEPILTPALTKAMQAALARLKDANTANSP